MWQRLRALSPVPGNGVDAAKALVALSAAELIAGRRKHRPCTRGMACEWLTPRLLMLQMPAAP